MDGATILQFLLGLVLVFMIVLGLNLAAPILTWSAAGLLVLLVVMAAANEKESAT